MVVPPSAGGATTMPPARPSPVSVPSTGTPKLKQPLSLAPGTLNGPPSGNNHAIPLSARRAERLDLSTVEHRGRPSSRADNASRNRVFGIPNAPVFRPTEEEFKNPMEYMRKIAPEGRRHGIVKIIPPASWNPTFAINTERFHFRTRRQELNSVEGGNRVNNDYLDQLAKFHKQNGHNLNRFPSVDKRPLDLYRLKKTVERKGGFDQVCRGKRWAEVGRDLGYSGKIMSSLSTSLKNSYQKWLLPYEEYLRLARPGVQQQLEMLNGGPYTPSPGPSPVKKSTGMTPLSGNEQTPTREASTALHATMSAHSPHQPQILNPEPLHPVPTPQHLPPPPAAGFTPVNPGGFTAVNTQPHPPQVSGFTAVNGTNGYHSNTATPPRSIETTPNAGQQVIAPHPTGVAAVKRQHSELTAEEIEIMNRRSKRLRKDVPTVVGSNMHHSRMGATARLPPRDRGDYTCGETCENCGRSDEPLKRIECQSCDSAYHLYCLEPPLKQMPEHEWHCARCLVGTNEYGFEEGDVYSLAGFQKRANEFKTQHFNNMPRQFSPFTETKRELEEDDVEREFWRLVEDLSDTTEVEYGADIHSTTHGSGFPTIERNPRDRFSADPWNLNILPLDKDSLFRHIKSDVSGMTVPWLYVGMIFSTFCWHNEDHFTYSANYQHFGETKTWYGIPGEDSNKFEQAMRDEVPELFETQPDILFQLVTLARPDKLRKAGVRVYAVDQHAGEFVITYPRAYHAGFNHGFNFNEAVNFAPHDWEPFGEEGVKRLRDYRKQPCFSHDEMLLTAASRDHSIRTAKWLAPALERMREEELSVRQQFLTGGEAEAEAASGDHYMGPRYEQKPELIDPDTEEEEVICTFCKAYCHLSRFVCRKTGKVLCLLHAGHYECCEAHDFIRFTGRNDEHTLCYRMSDDVLTTMVRKVAERANTPEVWAAKVDHELEENPCPSLKHLRTLLAEGERIQFDLPQLPDVKRFVDRCNDWVEEATSYITRKQTNRRKSEKAWRKGSIKAAEQEEREKELRSIAKMQSLLASADQIGFDCPEIHTLRERASSIEEFQRDANLALSDIHAKTTTDFEELVERGRDFQVDIPEMLSLDRVLTRFRWYDQAKQNRPNFETQRQDKTLNDIEKFLESGAEIGVPETNPDVLFFREHAAQGKLWEQKAKELMAVDQVHYQQLDALSRQASSLPVTPETLAAVEAILKKQREVQEKIVSLVERAKDPDFRKRPLYREMKDVMDALEELQSKPQGTIDLEKESRRHEDWMRRGKKLFGKANAPLHILHQHMQVVEKRNEACFDLADRPRAPIEPQSRQATPEEGASLAEGSSSSRDVFCICRRSEAGMMIECELCHEWYHGKCLKIARGKVKEDDKYTCPICDWRVKIPRDAARPKLEELQAWQDELETLPFQPEEERTLNNICDHAQAFRDYVRNIIEPAMPPTADEIGTLRFYLRKIEGSDILLASETNYLRRELHRFAPVAPIAPPVIQISGSTRKPRPTKQQKLMASLGITNPDDLPLQYKMKPHIAKRNKLFEGPGRTPALQPAGSMDSPTGSVTPGFPPSSSDSMQPYPTGMNPHRRPKHLTPLSLHVLGRLAEAPVVDEFLAAEPHANRDRLHRMKAVLEQGDPEICGDLEKFKHRVNSMPNPSSHTPGYSYETPEDRRIMLAGGGQDDKSMFDGRHSSGTPGSTGGASAARLGSPARFGSYGPGPGSASSPPPHPPTSAFDPIFSEHASGGMFHSMAPTPMPTTESKPALGSAATPGGIGGGFAGGTLFDSPKDNPTVHPAAGFVPNDGLNSPGFGGSHPGSGANIDNVFADLLHDDLGVSAYEGLNDTKTEPGLDVEMKDVPQ